MGKLKKIKALTSEIKDRAAVIEQICSLQKLNTAKIKSDLKINSQMVSINNIFDLCKLRKLRITVDFKTSELEVICEELELKGEKTIVAPEHIENTPSDFVKEKTLEEKFDDIEESEEPF
jgi:hypothetical protein